MKKYIIILAALFAISFVSCSKEDKAQQEELQQVTNEGTKLKVQVDENGTKVSMDAAGVFKWQVSDKIAVLNNAGTVYQFTASSSSSASEFTCPNQIDLGSYAQYPYSASFAASGDAVTFQIPSTFTYVADATNMPMLGKISAGVAHFKAVGALLKVIVYGVPSDATQIVFTATNKKVSGAFAIADASVAAPAIETAAKGASDNTVTIDFTGKRAENMVFYFPLPTGSIDGFSVAINGTGGTTKTVSGTVAFGRNKILVAPTINLLPAPTTMWKETFTGYAADTKFSGDAIQTGVGFDAVAYGGASITYTTVDGATDTKLYANNNAGGEAPELLVNKTNGSFTVSGIPSNGSSALSLEFKANGTTLSLSSPTPGVSIYGTYNASNNFTGMISNANNAASFDIVFSNATGSNVRIDDIEVKTAAPAPTISFTGTGTRTISAGALAASNVTDVTLLGGVDGTGIGVSSDVAWLTGTLSGSTLSIAASSYNHTELDRVGHIYLKATGATTKEITVTQKPTIVLAPTLSATPGDQTFTISWTPDPKAGSYIAYYSTTPDMADPTQGTALTINTGSTPYTTSPAATLTNGTTYYVYVKVNSVNGEYSDKYVASTAWAQKSVVPSAVVSEVYTVISNKTNITAGTYLLGSNNNNTFAGSTTIYLWTGGVTSNKLSKASDKTWDDTDKDFDNVTGAATVTLESAGSANVWRIKVGTKYLAASGTTFSLQDDTFDWTFDNLTGSKEGMFFYNTTSGTWVSSNAAGDVARAYNADNKVYKGIYLFKEN